MCGNSEIVSRLSPVRVPVGDGDDSALLLDRWFWRSSSSSLLVRLVSPLLPVVVGGVAKDAERVEEAVGRGDDDIISSSNFSSSSPSKSLRPPFSSNESFSSTAAKPPPPLRSSMCFLTTTTAFFRSLLTKGQSVKSTVQFSKNREKTKKKKRKKKGERHVNPKP